MKVLVCGGRNYADCRTVFETLSGIHEVTPISCVIEGGAPGADRFARRWAMENGVFYETFNADWKAHGNAAGPIRNQRMLVEGNPGRVIAFPGGKGTAGMVALAGAAGVPVTVIEE